VGGGSTEITYFLDGKAVEARSFKIGTLRQLKNKVPEREWEALDEWLLDIKDEYEDLKVIGSGGNINKYQ